MQFNLCNGTDYANFELLELDGDR